MDNLNNIKANALDRYFQVLSKRGSTNKDIVCNIVALCAICHIFDNFAECITEDDLRTISSIMCCIGGTCLIDCLSEISESSLFNELTNIMTLRISEDNIVRKSENEIFRIKE